MASRKRKALLVIKASPRITARWLPAGSIVKVGSDKIPTTRPLILLRRGKARLFVTVGVAVQLPEAHPARDYVASAGQLRRFTGWARRVSTYRHRVEVVERPLLKPAPKVQPPVDAPEYGLHPRYAYGRNREGLDMDYLDKLNPEVRAWLNRAMEHIQHNRWRHDSCDLVPYRTEGSRALHRLYNSRSNSVRLLHLEAPGEDQESGDAVREQGSSNPEDALVEYIDWKRTRSDD